MLVHPPWHAIAELRHGFLDARECAGGDGWGVAVRKAGVALPICTARQVHGVRVLTPSPGEPSGEGDALVVTRADIAVGVVTADCVPVLLVAPEHHAAAAIHAGWRGAASGVLEAAVQLLTAACASPPRLEAVIGPAIGRCCYEVGPEVEAAFRHRVGDLTAGAWTSEGHRRRVDLRSAVQLLLTAVGVRTLAVLGPCTSCGTGYNSYRRDGAAAGRQLSFVGWARS